MTYYNHQDLEVCIQRTLYCPMKAQVVNGTDSGPVQYTVSLKEHISDSVSMKGYFSLTDEAVGV